MRNRFAVISFILAFALLFTGCGNSQKDSSSQGASAEKTKLTIGISAGHEEEIWAKVKELAAKDGLELDIVTFNDYVQPNLALAEGNLDANAFQHLPYLEQFNKDHNLDIVSIADTLNYPMGIYSEKIKSVSDIKAGDTVGLPNDPTNGARALILFERAGLIKLKDGVGIKATVRDIAENPLNLKFQELEAPFIPKALGDLTAAVINTNFALENGLIPTKDSIFIEPNDSPWVNIIAVNAKDKDNPVFQKVIKAYHSDEVKQLIQEKFGDFIVPSW